MASEGGLLETPGCGGLSIKYIILTHMMCDQKFFIAPHAAQEVSCNEKDNLSACIDLSHDVLYERKKDTVFMSYMNFVTAW